MAKEVNKRCLVLENADRIIKKEIVRHKKLDEAKQDRGYVNNLVYMLKYVDMLNEKGCRFDDINKEYMNKKPRGKMFSAIYSCNLDRKVDKPTVEKKIEMALDSFDDYDEELEEFKKMEKDIYAGIDPARACCPM